MHGLPNLNNDYMSKKLWLGLPVSTASSDDRVQHSTNRVRGSLTPSLSQTLTIAIAATGEFEELK